MTWSEAVFPNSDQAPYLAHSSRTG